MALGQGNRVITHDGCHASQHACQGLVAPGSLRRLAASAELQKQCAALCSALSLLKSEGKLVCGLLSCAMQQLDVLLHLRAPATTAWGTLSGRAHTVMLTHIRPGSSPRQLDSRQQHPLHQAAQAFQEQLEVCELPRRTGCDTATIKSHLLSIALLQQPSASRLQCLVA